MLSAIRRFAQSWAAKVLMALLAISFVGWGINRTGVSRVAGDQVIKAGSRTITSPEFRREYDNYKKRIEEQSGQRVTPELAEQNHLDSAVLNGLATKEAFAELLSRIGIRPSDKLILAQIEKIPAFFDPISGRFDKKTFQRRLADNGMTPKMLDTSIRDDMAVQHLGVALQNGFSAPRAYGALAAVFALESRDLTFFSVNPESVPQPPAPTDAQLTAFINQNKAQLSLPEMRQFTLVPFSPAAVQAAVQAAPIDPAELKKRFDFKKETLSKPETRTLVQIPVKDQAAAAAVTARLGKGEAPAAIAKSLGVDAVDFADKPLSAISDRKVGEAAFKMTPGQVQTVQGDLGLSVVKLASVTPGQEMTMEQARPMLEAEIRKEKLAQKVYDQTQAYDDAHQGGMSVADAAAKAGVKATQLGPLSASGVNAQGQQLQGFPPKILQDVFSLPPGGESEVTELGDGNYYVVKVDKVVPAHVPPLDEIRPLVTRVWVQREIAKAMEAKGAALTARLQKGEAFDAVAAAGGYKVVRVTGLTRQAAQAHQDIPREVLGRAFGSKPGEVWSTNTGSGVVIGRIDNVQMTPDENAARVAETGRAAVAQDLFREMVEAGEGYARAKLKVSTDAERAREAAGFEPKADAKGKGKAAEKKG
jgi:peptidyl-prolyl cis-trans isomerase D